MIKEAIKFCIILCGDVFITFHKKNNRFVFMKCYKIIIFTVWYLTKVTGLF